MSFGFFFNHRYKWHIPVQWHSLKTDKNMLTIFNMTSAGNTLLYTIFCEHFKFIQYML